jgi:hypothetical protein
MNGLEFLRCVRENKITNVPVLMVTGNSDAEMRMESYKLGVYDFIQKPEQTEVMLKRIENGIKIGEMIDFNKFIKVELSMAQKLQKYLFPQPFLKTNEYEIKIWSRALSDIGGDLHDYVQFRDGRLIFFVADVSGHSIPASLYTAIVKMVFQNALKQTDDPGEIISIMNKELSGNIPVEVFITMFCGLVDPIKKNIKFSNAGHPAPYMKNHEKIEILEEHDSFNGVTGLLMFFLSINDYEIVDVKKIAINAQSTISPGRKKDNKIDWQNPPKSWVPGVEISFRKKNGRIQVVRYYMLNVIDYALTNSSPNFIPYLSKEGPFTTIIKSASYLMHNDKTKFTKIRAAVLENSNYIVQDDSGIPLRYFKSEKWQVKFHGHYEKPIGLFSHRMQPDLKNAMKKYSTGILPFSYGYDYKKGHSNLITAKKK